MLLGFIIKDVYNQYKFFQLKKHLIKSSTLILMTLGTSDTI